MIIGGLRERRDISRYNDLGKIRRKLTREAMSDFWAVLSTHLRTAVGMDLKYGQSIQCILFYINLTLPQGHCSLSQ